MAVILKNPKWPSCMHNFWGTLQLFEGVGSNLAFATKIIIVG
jgi:hypothetical protein